MNVSICTRDTRHSTHTGSLQMKNVDYIYRREIEPHTIRGQSSSDESHTLRETIYKEEYAERSWIQIVSKITWRREHTLPKKDRKRIRYSRECIARRCAGSFNTYIAQQSPSSKASLHYSNPAHYSEIGSHDSCGREDNYLVSNIYPS